MIVFDLRKQTEPVSLDLYDEHDKCGNGAIGVANNSSCRTLRSYNLHKVHAKAAATQEEWIGTDPVKRSKTFKFIRFKEFSKPERLNPKLWGSAFFCAAAQRFTRFMNDNV